MPRKSTALNRIAQCHAIHSWNFVKNRAQHLSLSLFLAAFSSLANAVDFQREIRPILAANCFVCHGPDDEARKSNLRLDSSDGATADLGGYRAIEPGNPSKSELWLRITSNDPELRMPPTQSHKSLTDVQRKKIAEWIEAGAVYDKHWSFELPKHVPLPAVSNVDTCRGPIDRFIQAKLDSAGLIASPEADRFSLVRRVYLDLIGIPPTIAEADRFVADPSPIAYERLVDSLLASPDYAERWLRPWLDLARYADTNGYEKDRARTIWPYRDWLLRSLAADMPYDAFSIKQLAGDMLPNATDEDQIATGFHRNTMLNEEGGIDPLEFRFLAMTDRVATTGLVWMGLTTGCAQCHTHKYDPITHTDYYSMLALLNNADETEREVDATHLSDQRQTIEDQIRVAEDEWLAVYLPDVKSNAELDLNSKLKSNAEQGAVATAYHEWIGQLATTASDWQVVKPQSMTSTSPALQVLEDGSILASGDATKRDVYTFRFEPAAMNDKKLEKITAIRLEVLPHESLPAEGPGMAYYEGRRGDFFLSELSVSFADILAPLRDASHSYGNLSIGSGSAQAANVIDGEGSTGWSTSDANGTANRWVANLATPVNFDSPIEVTLVFERHFAAALGHFRFSVTDRSANAVALSIDADQEAYVVSRYGSKAENHVASADDRAREHGLRRTFFQISESTKSQYAPLAKLRSLMPEAVRTLVMRERSANPRVTNRHHRGEYLQPMEVVQPRILDAFSSFTHERPANRLEFANWLVSDANPLVGRVTVDRAWRELFGRGIVHTAGDYGTQSLPPSHPELLDYLATEVADSGWSIKRLHREIVLSATYRRSNHRRAAVSAIDPENRLLAVGPRRRLEAERIRDSMLLASGLLVRKFGGPSVYPPQPQSVTELAYGNMKWPTSNGADRYRRSIYTYAKRTAPFAAFAAFDGPSGELCLPRRDISNSPLQSLTLLNDPMYVEFAERLVDDVRRELPDADDELVAATIFRRLMTRAPEPDELSAILEYTRAPEQQSDGKRSPVVLLAGVLLARAIMNLDEAITTP